MRAGARRSAFALALALLLAGCATAPQPAVETPAPSHEPNTVNVSVLLDLTGGRARSGQPQRDAMQLWLDRPPPTATLKVRVKFVDVASSSAKLLLELRRAATVDRADAIVVGVPLAGDASFADAAEIADVPILLTLPAAEPVSGVRGAWLFGLAPIPEAIARTTIADIVDRGIAAPMLLASDESATAVGERDAFVAELRRRGLSPPSVVNVGHLEEGTRIRAAFAVAKSVLFAGPTTSYVPFLRGLPPMTTPPRVYLSYVTEAADVTNVREQSALLTWPGSRWIAAGGFRGGDVARPSVLFVQSFSDRHGQPSTAAATAYDALTLIEAAAALAPGAIDRVRLRHALEANTVAGVVTRYTFSATKHAGFAPEDLALLVWDAQRNAAILPTTPTIDR